MDKGWFKIKTAARWVDVSPKTVRSWLSQGLPHSRIGGVILIRRLDLDRWLESHQVEEGFLDRVVEEAVEAVTRGRCIMMAFDFPPGFSPIFV